LLHDLKPLLEQSAWRGHSRLRSPSTKDRLGVETDANQLELALLNLVLNSRDAMPEGGTVTIRASRELPGRNQAPMVRLEVRDEGQGMSREVLRRATEPFFTTKSAGSGTGLGLAQVFGIVRQSGGSMSIDSEPGNGTAVALLLPLLRPSRAARRRCTAGPGGAGCRPADHPVRRRRRRAQFRLAGAGRSRLCGRNGLRRSTAVEIARNADASLLVIDFAMHGMNGAEVIDAVPRHPSRPAGADDNRLFGHQSGRCGNSGATQAIRGQRPAERRTRRDRRGRIESE
jgi:hypothetical protein